MRHDVSQNKDQDRRINQCRNESERSVPVKKSDLLRIETPMLRGCDVST
jgi:hypothetical protein